MIDLKFENDRYLDVVNEKDEVIDSKSRVDIHNLGLLHREVHVWMFDVNRNIFFQKRGLHRKSAGLLDATVGGHANKGEDYIDAAIRETKEETGITIKSSDLIFLAKHTCIMSTKVSGISVTTNNYMRTIFIYKSAVSDIDLKKEIGIPGNGFQKLSYETLLSADESFKSMIQNSVFTEEVPLVLKYINEQPAK
ncbi:NUDIX domain-containing protein [Patescibacteria group bacterium]|nr:NUDIX domain-containing protein [Patescibacteria group bacterium]